MRYCSRCILPGNYRNIRFDSDGVCNYCRSYDELEERLTDFESLGRLLVQRFDRFRGKHAYDCLVGLSGGKDSSYVAMRLKQDYGLNILAFTFDNGFLTDYARNNIEKVTGTLGIDHFFYQVDWALHSQFYRESVRWFGTPCPGCSYAGYSLMHKIAFQREIPLIVHGRSRSQMFREILAGSPDAFLPFVSANLAPFERNRVIGTTVQAKKKLEYFLKASIKDRIVRKRFEKEFFPDMDGYAQAEVVPEFLGYFLYHPYNEPALMEELKSKLPGWERPPGGEILTHQDCAAHDAAAYLFEQVFGYNMLSFELSVLIRDGTLSRQEALGRLAREPHRDEPPEESLNLLCERLSIPAKELPKIIQRAARSQRRRKKILEIKNRLLKPSLDLGRV